MNVAIIDDTPVNLALMQALVGKIEHCTSHAFVDPRQGLAWCLENDPDLVIVDYMMPELDGLELIRRLRAADQSEDLPVLMVTARTRKGGPLRSARMRGNRFSDQTHRQERVSSPGP